MSPRPRVLFVCVENSCRSQMAQAFALMAGAEAYSAGSKPSGVVNPKAITSMAEVGYDLSVHESKSLEEIPDGPYDLVATMGCGDACPQVAAHLRADWQIPDPKHMDSVEFAQIRDMVRHEVVSALSRLDAPQN